MFGFLSTKLAGAFAEVSKSFPSHPEPLVDLSDIYTNLLHKDVHKGYFTTSKSYRDIMNSQLMVFERISCLYGFWSIVSSRKKNETQLYLHIVELVKCGIPPQFRGRMWQRMCGIQSQPMHFMPYTDLLELHKKEELVAQIEQDVARTFPDLGDQLHMDKLSRVLTAYSLRNPKLGLLIFMEEEDAFWMLVYIVEELLRDYFRPPMAGFNIDTDIFELLVAEQLPDLYKHLQNVHLNFRILTSPWFLCLYVNAFPPETSFVIWDNIMMEGVVAMFEVGLAILRMLEGELLMFTDQGELINHIRERTLAIYDPTKLLKYWYKLDKKMVLRERQCARKRLEEEALVMSTMKEFGELEGCTHCIFRIEPKDFLCMWKQYNQIEPSLPKGKLTLDAFSKFVCGTFSEWWTDSKLVERLFHVADEKNDGVVDFAELVKLLSVICRGTRKEIVSFNFRLCDTKGKGCVDKFDMYRYLQSIYAVFRSDKKFHSMLRFFVDTIFDYFCSDTVSQADFEHIVSLQPQIIEQFKTRNPKVKFNPKHTFFYWMFMNRPNKDSELIPIILSMEPQAQVLLPPPSPITTSTTTTVNKREP